MPIYYNPHLPGYYYPSGPATRPSMPSLRPPLRGIVEQVSALSRTIPTSVGSITNPFKKRVMKELEGIESAFSEVQRVLNAYEKDLERACSRMRLVADETGSMTNYAVYRSVDNAAGEITRFTSLLLPHSASSQVSDILAGLEEKLEVHASTHPHLLFKVRMVQAHAVSNDKAHGMFVCHLISIFNRAFGELINVACERRLDGRCFPDLSDVFVFIRRLWKVWASDEYSPDAIRGHVRVTEALLSRFLSSEKLEAPAMVAIGKIIAGKGGGARAYQELAALDTVMLPIELLLKIRKATMAIDDPLQKEIRGLLFFRRCVRISASREYERMQLQKWMCGKIIKKVKLSSTDKGAPQFSTSTSGTESFRTEDVRPEHGARSGGSETDPLQAWAEKEIFGNCEQTPGTHVSDKDSCEDEHEQQKAPQPDRGQGGGPSKNFLKNRPNKKNQKKKKRKGGKKW